MIVVKEHASTVRNRTGKQRGHLSAHASEGQCVEYANREILAELKIESVI